MASEVFKRIPTVFSPGNHEHYSNDDKILFNSTFQTYNVTKDLATGFRFLDTYIVPFDPFNTAYSKKDDPNEFEALRKELKKGEETGLFVIAFAHYPLTCSGDSRCAPIYEIMKKYYDIMVEHGTSLYLAGHSHIY